MADHNWIQGVLAKMDFEGKKVLKGTEGQNKRSVLTLKYN